MANDVPSSPVYVESAEHSERRLMIARINYLMPVLSTAALQTVLDAVMLQASAEGAAPPYPCRAVKASGEEEGAEQSGTASVEVDGPESEGRAGSPMSVRGECRGCGNAHAATANCG